ncbi:unnamed protein product [Rotaria sp. Silwood1]|nr:unnamed protein product [Rotaria sp. Silwood1]CAF1646678.1 unnamed protein product [Rotaria sp. Silwood1]
MYTLLLKEALLDIEDDNKKSIKELAEYCRLQSDASEATIKKLEEGYGDHSPIWWYTGRYFIYSMLSYGLRLMKVEIILKMGFFIRHLHQDIQNLYDEQKAKNMIMDSPYKVYRGQGLSVQDFEIMKKCQGQLMSFNNFLSTSLDRDVSLDFAQAALKDTDTVGILFHMIIDPVICEELKIPFGDIDYEHTDRLWQVNLTLAGNDDHELNSLTAHLRDDASWTTGWSRLGYILIKLGESIKAK